MQRKLAAILAADVVGYSRLMEADEANTLARLKSTRTNLIDPKIAAHNGRIVKLMGDGALVEFPSVVDAVGCAVEIQRAMAECNAELPAEKQLEFRIGVNLGDVIVEGEDIYGDGVNVAARLEGLAEPGGVLISGTAFDQVERKLEYGFEFLGEQKVKNIETPVRLYRVGLRASGAAQPPKSKPGFARHWLAAAALVAIAFIAAALLWQRYGDRSAQPIEVASPSKLALPLPDKPSIAVLPFTNMSSDAEQENFTDGMTDDLITDLSKISGLFVISRNSTFVYKGAPVRVNEVAEELGVRYVLEGSVRRAGDRLRVNAQLIDAFTGGHVWADRFDGDIADIFSVQDTFVRRIVEALEVTLTPGESKEIASGKTQSINAKEAFDEGWSLYLRYNPKDTAAAIEALKRAVELDPEYGRAYAALSLCYTRIYDSVWFKEFGLSDFQTWTEEDRYLEFARKYPTSLLYTIEALRNVFLGLGDTARRDAGRAIALDPNDPEAHIAMAWALTISGEPKEALNFVATAIRLNPNYPSHYALANAMALFADGRLEEAAKVLEAGIAQYPQAVPLMMPLASILAQLGLRAEARDVLLKWRGADQQAVENLAETYKFPYKWSDAHQDVRVRLYDGLRLTSLPLEVTVPTLVAQLETGGPFERIAAAKKLGWFGPAASEAVPALIAALNIEYLRQEAVQSLGKIGPAARAAVPSLLALEDQAVIGAYAKESLEAINRE
jgi:TolB-like protein/class 3 adenylate cyclase/Tfp pilus assembly protein PilF